MAKTLVHKTNRTEVITIAGLLGEDLSVTGESGDKVSLEEQLQDFVGQEVVLSFRTKEEETIEVIE